MRLHKGYLAKYETAYYVFVPSTGMYDMFIIKQKYVSPRNYSTKKFKIVPTGPQSFAESLGSTDLNFKK